VNGDVAHTAIGKAIAEFFAAVLLQSTAGAKAIDALVHSSALIVEPLINSQAQEAFVHLSSACNSDYPMPEHGDRFWWALAFALLAPWVLSPKTPRLLPCSARRSFVVGVFIAPGAVVSHVCWTCADVKRVCMFYNNTPCAIRVSVVLLLPRFVAP
jgi:hypothetical protein